MKKGVKEVTMDGSTVVVDYEDGGQAVMNFTDPDAALSYCAFFGGREKKPAAKAPPAKKKAKKK